MDQPWEPRIQGLHFAALTSPCSRAAQLLWSQCPQGLGMDPDPLLGWLMVTQSRTHPCVPGSSRHCSTCWARAGVTLLGTLRCVWVLIFGAIRPGTEPKSSSNWPFPVILPDKTIKFLRQEMFFANVLCQMLLLFLSVVFRDLFLILTHYFMRHRLVLPALLKLSITLMFVCCLRASLTVCEGGYVSLKKKIK